MPSTGTHRYDASLAPISRGTVAVSGTLTLPSTGTSTFKLGASVYYERGIYTLYTFGTLSGGTVSNLVLDASNLPAGLSAGTPYREGNAIKVAIQ